MGPLFPPGSAHRMREAILLDLRTRSTILFSLAIAAGSCGEQKPTTQRSSDEQPERPKSVAVISYSGGAQPRSASLRVGLDRAVVQRGDVSKAPAKSPMACVRAFEGRAEWANQTSLEFVPAAPLERGKRYRARIANDGIEG